MATGIIDENHSLALEYYDRYTYGFGFFLHPINKLVVQTLMYESMVGQYELRN